MEEVGSLLGEIASNGRPSLVLVLGHAKLSANLITNKFIFISNTIKEI